jgi:hypothetical protein
MAAYESPLARSVATPPGAAFKSPNYLGQLNRTREQIELKACQDIRFSKPVVSLAGTGIIYPNSITTIQGQKGAHKSRLTELICAAIMCKLMGENSISLTIEPDILFHCVYVDSERNKNDQFPYAIQRIKERAGYQKHEHPINLEAISLIDIAREERFEALTQYLESVHSRHPEKYTIVVLDVITDCIGSFNDPKESMKLIDHLNMVINKYNVSFVCVIHENPNSFGDSKARGHLGTELINKATTVLSIGYEKTANKASSDLLSIKFIHTRSSKRPDPVYVRYCEEERGLVLADEGFVQEQKSLKATKAGLREMRDWLIGNLYGEMSKVDLVGQLREHFDCTDKTIDTRLKELTDGEEPFLVRSKQGKEVYFSRKASF